MSLSIAQLRELLTGRVGFSGIEQVGDCIIRSTRMAGEIPFAVYYFDVAPTLPETQEQLTKYQDQVIGSRYFEGGKSLQWSNYLYFIASRDRLASGQLNSTKELIEGDRNYARKFVIPEDELESVLKPQAVENSNGLPRVGILSIWMDLLAGSHLDSAIFNDDDLPKRLKLVESPPTESTAKSNVAALRQEAVPAPYLRSLRLEKFRNTPLQRHFEFGVANLLFGANGTGKTSLLEAIELFYCGRNKRNPNDSKPYELLVELSDGRTETATNGRRRKIFRDRNLAWYGQPEVKTNNLYLSFGQFNFLDTDAAVSLSESTSRIEDDLAKLLVGADASKTWRNIERISEAVIAKLRELQARERQIKDELGVINRLLRESGNVRQESDSIGRRLHDMIRPLGWNFGESDNDLFPGRVVESLSELESLAQQSASLGWAESPVSINRLAKYCDETGVACKKAEVDIDRLDLSLKNEKRLTGAIERNKVALKVVEQAKRYIDAGLPVRKRELERQKSTITKYSNSLAGLSEGAIESLSTEVRDVALTDYSTTVRQNRFAADAALQRAKTEYANFSRLREHSLNLAQQLREISVKILQISPKRDECPLCHTQFAHGDLVNHINQGVDQHLEATGQSLLTEMRKQEDALRNAVAAEALANWFKAFCERADIAAEVSVNSVLLGVAHAKRTLAEAQSRVTTLGRELQALEVQGLSFAKWEEILGRLRELEVQLIDDAPVGADRVLSSINAALAENSRAIEAARKQTSEVQRAVEAALGSTDSTIQGLKRVLSQLKERCSTTESLRAKLMRFTQSVPWPGDRALAELVVEARAVREVAVELQTAQGRERQAKAVFAEAKKREEDLVTRLSRFGSRINRLNEAQTAFENIRRNHSLAGAMDSALRLNRTGIETIFLRIHAPRDFRGLGSNLKTLVRKADGKEATLSQISTGQRAAFALSIFLAQNSQLKLAPPVLLIDDPIAHVDDLNSLSFLDYLREIVLTGRRQIFFSTASNKLATLFERKFDFLGNQRFRRFDLPLRT